MVTMMQKMHSEIQVRSRLVKKIIGVLGVLLALATVPFAADAASTPDPVPAKPVRTELTPLMERYLIDELKTLRTEMQDIRTTAIKEITDRELNVALEAVSYSNNTVTFFFYVFAIVGAMMALLGWRSIADLKRSVNTMAENEIRRLSSEYENRFTSLEIELQKKGEIILENQKEIERTQTVHALWQQASQATTPRGRIEIYDQILELTPNEPETMTAKADAALELGDREWALSLCTRVLDAHEGHTWAYYHRARAHAGLGLKDAAVQDLKSALALTPNIAEAIKDNEEFEDLDLSEVFSPTSS